jgi:RNA polymerase primary sigma factor
MVAEGNDRSAVRRGLDPKSLWYAPDRRIRTGAAAREAMDIARRVAAPGGSTADCEDYILFKALQTCAYQAAGPLRGRQISRTRRREWASRWRGIRDHIVERNMPLARWLVRRRSAVQTNSEAFLSEASLALVRAVERFNPWLGYRFSTYASRAIVRAMTRLGRHENRYRNRFPLHYDVSFERPVEPEPLYPQLCVERLHRVLDTNAAELTGLESRVIADRFGLGHRGTLTLRQIGDVVGMSKERVRQIQHAALEKIRDVLVEDPMLQ